MKRSLLFSAIMLMLSYGGRAQPALGTSEIEPLDIKGAQCIPLMEAQFGAALGWICAREIYRGDNSYYNDDVKYRAGASFAMMYGFALCNSFRFLASLGLSQTGAKWVNADNPEQWYNRSNHLQLSLLPLYMFGSNFIFQVGLGLYASYWMCGNQRYVNEMQGIDQKDPYDFKNLGENWKTNRIQGGIETNIGVSRQLGPGFLGLAFILNYSLVTNSRYQDLMTNEWTNNSFNEYSALRLSYRVPVCQGKPPLLERR